MKYNYLIIQDFFCSLKVILCLSILLCYGFTRIENSRALIIKNKVQSEIKSTCNGGCSGEYRAYDKRGNEVAYDFYRVGTRYKLVYDDADNHIMTLWIDKTDPSQIDTLLTNQPLFGQTKAIYDEQRSEDGKLLKKYWGEKRIEIYYNDNNQEIKEFKFERDTMIHSTTMTYDSKSRLIEKVAKNVNPFKNAYYVKRMGGEKIDTFIDRYKYNEKGQVTQLFTYFVDPCMGLDNHYLYLYYYHDNGLLESAEVYENGSEFAFSLEYEYEFYK